MYNKSILIGRLCSDPELRHTNSGTPVASLVLAVDRDFTNKEGEKETDFIPVVAWSKLGEVCHKHLSKGRLVAVDGRLQIRNYTDKDGNKRKAAEVVAREVKFLPDGKGKGNSNQSNDNPVEGFGSEISFNPDDCPF